MSFKYNHTYTHQHHHHLCVCDICMCVHTFLGASAEITRYVCGGQKTPQVLVLTFHLRRDRISLSAAVFSRLRALQASGLFCLLLPSPQGALGLQELPLLQTSLGLWGSELKSSSCVTSTLPTETSPQSQRVQYLSKQDLVFSENKRIGRAYSRKIGCGISF